MQAKNRLSLCGHQSTSRITGEKSILKRRNMRSAKKQKIRQSNSMSLFSAVSIVISTLLLPRQTAAQDVLCRRWDHQAAVLDGKIYMMGGYQLSLSHIDPKSKNNTQFNNGRGAPTNEFISLDLTKNWQIAKDTKLTNPPKWGSISNVKFGSSDVTPALAAGGLFTSSDGNAHSLVLYDGKALNTPRDQQSELAKWTVGDKSWTRIEEWRNPVGSDGTPSGRISRFSRGTPVQVPGKSRAFYVGGARIWEKDKDYDWYYPEDIQLMDVHYENGEVKNRTMSQLWNNTKTIGAAAVWVPIGKEGSLVVVGGTMEQAEDRRIGTTKDNKAEPRWVLPKDKMRPFSETLIYDIAEKKWYSQKTRGVPLPAPRSGACLIHRSHRESDGSLTHQLFLYGGSSGSSFAPGDPLDDEVFFGDLYVLSIPAFRWLRFTDIPNAPAARTRHTCHVINERQLLVLGGGRNDTLSNNNILKTSCVWDFVSVLDLNDLRWELEYKPASGEYKVNDVIREDSLVDGKPRMEPEAGWSSPELENWFFNGNGTGNGGGTTDIPPKTKLPLIVGVVLGSIAAAGAFLLGRFYWNRRQRKTWDVSETIINPYNEESVGVVPGTQALPGGVKGHKREISGASGASEGMGLGISSTSGPEITEAPVSELPDTSVISGISGGAGGVWGKKHAYTPVAGSDTAADTSGPYLFSTHGGQTFAAELSSDPASGPGPYAAAYELPPDERSTLYAGSSVRDSRVVGGYPAPGSPYSPSGVTSPYMGSGWTAARGMTHDESRRVSRDIETYMRQATEGGNAARGTVYSTGDEAERGQLLQSQEHGRAI